MCASPNAPKTKAERPAIRQVKLPEAPPEPSRRTLNATCEIDAVPPPERCAVVAAVALGLAHRPSVAPITATYARVRFKVSSLSVRTSQRPGAPPRSSADTALPCRRGGLVPLLSLPDREDRDTGERRSRAQIRRPENGASRERHDDALRLAGAEADRAEVAVHLDRHVRDRRLARREERRVHDQHATLVRPVARSRVRKANNVIRLPRSTRDDMQRQRRSRLEVVEASAAVGLIPIEATGTVDDHPVRGTGHRVEDQEVVAGLAVRSRSVMALVLLAITARRPSDQQCKRE